MSLPAKVKLVDVGPRDGLQNEKQPVTAAAKIELVHRLQEAGVMGDDMRIVLDSTHNLYEKDVRRLVIVLEPAAWDPMKPTAEYTALLAEVAAARQTPEYRQRTAERLLAVGVAAAKKAAGKPRGKRAAPAKKPAAVKAKRVAKAPAKPRKAPVRKPPK